MAYPERDSIIGIVGGMGPAAGIALMNNILVNTHAKIDQQHLSVIMGSLPSYIPDRTAYLEGQGQCNPAYNIIEVIGKLELAGAGVIGIACNTSHSPEIFNVILEGLEKKKSNVKLLHMPLETCDYIRLQYPTVRKVGLLTTNGMYKSGLYKNIIRQVGLEPIIPDEALQNHLIHRMVYDPVFGIKANPNCIKTELKLMAREALDYFIRRKADAIILGCTELSLIFTGGVSEELIIVDSTASMARALIREITRNCPSH